MEDPLNNNVQGQDAYTKQMLLQLLANPQFSAGMNALWATPHQFNVQHDPMMMGTKVSPNPGKGFDVRMGAMGDAPMQDRQAFLMNALMQALGMSQMPAAPSAQMGAIQQMNQAGANVRPWGQ